MQFSEWIKLRELIGATADLYGGYHKGVDYQIEGDPSSMIQPREPHRQKKQRKKKRKKR